MSDTVVGAEDTVNKTQKFLLNGVYILVAEIDNEKVYDILENGKC